MLACLQARGLPAGTSTTNERAHTVLAFFLGAAADNLLLTLAQFLQSSPFFSSWHQPLPAILQAGTDQGDAFRGIAVRSTDGAALLAGWTNDNWVADGTVNLYSEIAGVLIETGALAPTPVPATLVPSVSPTSAPVAVGSSTSPATFAPVSRSGPSCGATEPFQVTSVDLPVVEGCYQATEASYSTGGAYEVWSVSGTLELGEVVVVGFTDDGTGEYVSQVPSVGRWWCVVVFFHPSHTMDPVHSVTRGCRV